MAHTPPVHDDATSPAATAPDFPLGMRLRELAEPLVSVSLWHLRPHTRELLSRNALSINAYPTQFGGLVFVGAPRQRIPTECELDGITKLTARAGVAWLLFDAEAPAVEGLPLFHPDEVDTWDRITD